MFGFVGSIAGARANCAETVGLVQTLLQFAPPSIVLKRTPPIGTYSVLAFGGAAILKLPPLRVRLEGSPVLMGVQLAPPSVLLNIPLFTVDAYTMEEFDGST